MNENLFLHLMHYLPIHCIFRPFYSGIGSILMFHRIVEDTNAARIGKNRRGEISPEYLESIIGYFMEHHYDIVSPDEVYEILLERKKQNRFVCFTFDDGYADTFTLAYPIFKKWNAPFTIYVSTDFPDKNALLWWYALEALVLREDRITFTHHNERFVFPAGSPAQKDAAFHVLRRMIIRESDENLGQLLKDLFGSFGVDSREYSERLSLNWDQIEEMSGDPLVTIGAHTVHHYALTKLKEEQVRDEIERSRQIIESRIGKSVEHFSYPFGSRGEAGEREFGIVKRCRFKTATTTRIGNIFPEHQEHLECLPRIPVRGIREDLLSLEALVSGYLPAVAHKFRRVVAS